MSVLVLRPQPEADATARELRRRGHDAIVSPLLAAAPGDPPPTGSFDAVAATSPRALRALDALPARPPLFVVGERCAVLARGAGWDVRAAADDARHLTERIAFRRPSHVLHAAPAERAFDLEAALGAAGIGCTTWIAYRMLPLALVEEARSALRRRATVLLTSPRIAAIFAAQWRGVDRRAQAPRLLAISPAAAAPVEGVGPVQVAGRPTLAALLELL